MNRKNSMNFLATESNDVAENKLNCDWSIYKRERVRWLEPIGNHSNA